MKVVASRAIHRGRLSRACVVPQGREGRYAPRMLKRLVVADNALVPAVWPLEVTNGLLVAERRGRLRAADPPGLVDMLVGLPVDVSGGQSPHDAAPGSSGSKSRQATP